MKITINIVVNVPTILKNDFPKFVELVLEDFQKVFPSVDPDPIAPPVTVTIEDK